MKALTYHGPADIRYEDVPDAEIRESRDVVVKMERSGICGSDLHIYHGTGFSPALGFSIGHEAIGEVVEVGADVRERRVGERVMVSAAVACGDCNPCLAGRITDCQTGRSGVYGIGPSLEGCQAELVRVPVGDLNAAPIPDGIDDDQAVVLTDNLPTGWFGARNADIRPGATVAVVGLGPVGLMAIESAYALGAARVFAIDQVPERRTMAETLGATALAGEGAAEAIQAENGGRLADSVIEAAGADATIQLAIGLAAANGTISVVGVNQNMDFRFPMALAVMKSLTFRAGLCSVQQFWPEIIPLVQAGRIRPERIVTHRFGLAEGAEAYRLFEAREAGALKMVLRP